MPEIAAEAEFQLQASLDQLNWLTALASAIQLDHTCGRGKYAEHLAQVAAFLSDTGFSGVDTAISEFKSWSEYAPQNAEVPNRGAHDSKVSLADFAKGRQQGAARDLGVSQAAINKAIRLKREIFVTRYPDGSLIAVEEKPFPGREREGDRQ
jgi:16S rRNA C1402 N4-methylase RsmH